MSDLTTAEAVLAWADSIAADFCDGSCENPQHFIDTPKDDHATAAKLARAMRLLKAFELIEQTAIGHSTMYGEEGHELLITLRAALEGPK